MLLAEGFEHAREQPLLRIAARGVAHHALLVRELALELERVLPVELSLLGRRGGDFLLFGGLRHGLPPVARGGRRAVFRNGPRSYPPGGSMRRVFCRMRPTRRAALPLRIASAMDSFRPALGSTSPDLRRERPAECAR